MAHCDFVHGRIDFVHSFYAGQGFKVKGSGIAEIRQKFDDKIISYVLKPKNLQSLQSTHKELVAKAREVEEAKAAMDDKLDGKIRRAGKAVSGALSAVVDKATPQPSSVRKARGDKGAADRQGLLDEDE